MVPMVQEAYMINLTGKDRRIFATEYLISRKIHHVPSGWQTTLFFRMGANIEHFVPAGFI